VTDIGNQTSGREAVDSLVAYLSRVDMLLARAGLDRDGRNSVCRQIAEQFHDLVPVELEQASATQVEAALAKLGSDAAFASDEDGTNLHTKRPVRINNAQRLRNRVKVPREDESKPGTKRTPTPRAKKPAKATKEATAANKRDTGREGAPGGQREGHDAKPMSLLDAAAHLLSLGTGDPMRCQDIVDLAIQRGLWTPGAGKTPANTLYASILREIKNKGQDSRFVKAKLGKFALTRKA